MAYSMDLRHAVVKAAADDPTLSCREIAKRFSVTHSTVGKWIKRHREGRLEPERPGPQGPRVVNEEDLATLRRLVEERPGTTSEEAAEVLGHKISAGYVRVLWLRMGYSFKKR